MFFYKLVQDQSPGLTLQPRVVSWRPTSVILHSLHWRNLRNFSKHLTSSHIPHFLVGGAVRDLLLQPALLPHDFDMTCFSTEEQLVKALRGFSCRKRGAGSFDITVAGTHVEVTIARKEGPYSDKRHPDWIEPGNLLDDYVRRDFTVNAIYLDILNCELWDVGGASLSDLAQGKLNFIGEGARRMREDPLRILRFLRYFSLLNPCDQRKLPPAVLQAKEHLGALSLDRVITELQRARYPASFVEGLVQLGFFPGTVERCRDLKLDPFFKVYPLSAIYMLLSSSSADREELLKKLSEFNAKKEDRFLLQQIHAMYFKPLQETLSHLFQLGRYPPWVLQGVKHVLCPEAKGIPVLGHCIADSLRFCIDEIYAARYGKKFCSKALVQNFIKSGTDKKQLGKKLAALKEAYLTEFLSTGKKNKT